MFKVPIPRNVARRQPFFHNGKFSSLKDALTFYVQRDTNPEKCYPRDPNGSIRKFDDIPLDMQSNIKVSEAAFDRNPGDQPALDDGEIDDLIALLKTLNDGWKAN